MSHWENTCERPASVVPPQSCAPTHSLLGWTPLTLSRRWMWKAPREAGTLNEAAEDNSQRGSRRSCSLAMDLSSRMGNISAGLIDPCNANENASLGWEALWRMLGNMAVMLAGRWQ